MSNLETNENRFYNSFLSYSFHPADEYRRFEQELAFEDFENSPTWYDDIEQETEFGSLEFKKIEARVNQIMDSKVGDRVNKGDVLCVIEAMKTFNEIYAEYDCIVEEILVKEDTLVECNQELMVVRKND